MTITNATAVGSFPYVDDYKAATLSWYATVGSSSSSVFVGTTTNEVYVTCQATQVSPPADHSDDSLTNYRTLFSVGCNAAKFDTDPNSVIQDIWTNAFATRSVQTAEGMPLYYYNSYRTPNWTTTGLLTPTSSPTSSGSFGDGKCGAWTRFMADVIKAQGIVRTGNFVPIAAVNPPPGFPAGLAAASTGFLVSNWTFGAQDAVGAISGILTLAPDQVKAVTAQYPYVDVVTASNDPINGAGNAYAFQFADVTYASGTPRRGRIRTLPRCSLTTRYSSTTRAPVPSGTIPATV